MEYVKLFLLGIIGNSGKNTKTAQDGRLTYGWPDGNATDACIVNGDVFVDVGARVRAEHGVGD